MAKKSGASASKSAIIREALDKGITVPAAIAAYAKQSKGLEIDPKYISVIKSNILNKGKGGRGRRSAVNLDAQKEAMMFALKCGTIDKAKKALEAVRSDPALAFAANMGGVDRAIAALSDLASHVGEQ